MKLYHYNSKKLKTVKSRAALDLDKPEAATEGVEGDPFNYIKSTSWFMEPIPRDLPSILHGEHEYWKPGIVLYEHIIDINDLPDDVYYHLVESHARTELMNKQPWDRVSGDRGSLRSKLIRELDDLELKLGLKGQGRDNLKEIIRTTPRDIRKDYKALYDTWVKEQDPGLMRRYASGVPHLMLYVDMTPIPVRKVNRVILDDVKTSNENFSEVSLRW